MKDILSKLAQSKDSESKRILGQIKAQEKAHPGKPVFVCPDCNSPKLATQEEGTIVRCTNCGEYNIRAVKVSGFKQN